MEATGLLSSVEAQMSLLLLVALGGWFLASLLRQPAVVGQILAGMIIGPSWLGWISHTEFVSDLAAMGAVILLFVIGLEFQFRDIAKPKYILIAAVGVILPWGAGTLLAMLYGFSFERAMFVGVALGATSVAISADVLRELGKLRTEAAKAIIGAAVIDDVLALLALSITIQIKAGNLEWTSVSWMLMKALVFLGAGVAIGLGLVNPAIRWLHDSVFARKFPEMVFVFALTIAFLYAVAAELIGLSAIVGAFLAGVCLEAILPTIGTRFRDGAEYLRIVFGAIFFVSLGVIADLRTLSWELASFVTLLTVVAVASKFFGCGLPALWSGETRRNAWIIGAGMTPRGEVAMIVALLALNAGIIAQPAYLALVITALFTSFIAPFALRILYRSKDGMENA